MPIVKLKPAERDFLLKECPVMEDELIDPIEKAAFLDGWYTFRLEQEWLEDFIGWIAAFNNHEEDRDKEKVFDAIYNRLVKQK